METQVAQIAEKLIAANSAYRRGLPIMSDAEYDLLTAELCNMELDHPYLNQVEPEPSSIFSEKRIRHEKPMLSTEKAYDYKALATYIKKVNDAAQTLGITDAVVYRVTPKLDGLAAYWDKENGVLATRGDGMLGEDISGSFDRGLRLIGENQSGPGEIVMPRAFFLEKLIPEGFTKARNFMVGFVSADTLKSHHILVGESGMAHFVPYASLKGMRLGEDHLLSDILRIASEIMADCEYDTDGVVVEVIDESIKAVMGHTNHHHRWQIAFKGKGEVAETTVRNVVWQTGRTGRITPVIEIDPVDLSGATIRRVTAHNLSKAKNDGLGVGSRVRIIRSGEVIPYIEAVLVPAALDVPHHCPSCGAEAVEEGEYLTCTNLSCSAQAEGRIVHFFETLGTADGFGPKAAEKIVACGITHLVSVLELEEIDLINMGFGEKQSQNMVNEIKRCINTPIEDWKFLAAFGVRHLGRGDSKNLLAALGGMKGLLPLDWEKIAGVSGFAEKTAKSMVQEMCENWDEIEAVWGMGFDLKPSESPGKTMGGEKPLNGLHLVFTGTFSTGRDVLEQKAETLGAKVQSAVNKKTSFLVVGENAGTSKTKKARDLGIEVCSEADYRTKAGVENE